MEKVILKLGGSVVTKKTSDVFPTNIVEIRRSADEYIRFDVIKRIAKEIIAVKKTKKLSLMLINGVGPFGHYLVSFYLKNRNLIKPRDIHDSVAFLNSKIVSCLRGYGLEIISLDPFSSCYFTSHGFETLNLFNSAVRSLEKGYIPSTYGDIVPAIGTKGRLMNYEVISGDDLAVELAKDWKADKIIMATDVDGVFDKNPKLHKGAKLVKKINEKSKIIFEPEKDKIDVTGGFSKKIAKLKSAAKEGIKSHVVNGLVKDNVKRALLNDEKIGSLILT